MTKIGKLILAGILCLALFLPFVSGCERRTKYTDSGFEWFDTFYTFTAFAHCEEAFESYANTVFDLLGEYHRLLDIYHTYDGLTNLKSVNDQAGNGSLPIDPRLGDFLAYAKEIHTLTNGYTNIAMGSVLSLWHEARMNADENGIGVPPNEASLLEALKHTNIEDLVLSEDHTTVSLTDPQLSLDAGALGKGYVAERIANALVDMGCDSFLLNLGGNTVAYGEKTKKEPWRVGLETPEGYADFSGTLTLSGEALVTSGSYQRYFSWEGKTYHHIIHPQTGYPEDRYVSVSVLAKDSALADALSTALFSMPLEEGQALIESLPDTEAVWLLSDGNRVNSSGFSHRVTQGG